MSSALAKSYLTFTREEQRLVGVSAKQAPVLMSPQLNKFIPQIRRTARSGHTLRERMSITRDMALFCVAFHTRGSGSDLACTLGAQVVRFPEGWGFVFNFQFGKTFRSSSQSFVVRFNRNAHLPGSSYWGVY